MPCSERIGPSQAGVSVVLRSTLHSMAWAIACALRSGSDFMLRCWSRCSHTSTSKSQPTRSRACLAFSTFTSTRGSWPRRLVTVPERTRPIKQPTAPVLTSHYLATLPKPARWGVAAKRCSARGLLWVRVESVCADRHPCLRVDGLVPSRALACACVLLAPARGGMGWERASTTG